MAKKEYISASFIEAMEGKAQPSLRAIADVLGVPQQRIYSVAKQPKAGEIYDARVYNWEAINKFISKRIGKEGDAFGTFDEVYAAAVARDEELATTDRRRGSHGGTKAVIDLGNGKQMPTRKTALELGDIVYLKKYSDTFKVVYLTETHVVLQVEGNPGLVCLSNWTFNQQVAKEPKPIEETPVDGATAE